MKKICILFISFCFLSLTNDNGNVFNIPLNQKIILKVTQKSSTEFEFTEVEREPFDKIVDMWDNDDALSISGNKETIEFYFCQAQDLGHESTALIMKSRSKFSLQFDTEIQKTENAKFEKVPNVGTHTNSKTQESWGYKINQIRISNFRLKK